ncbi:uncharacterized protein LOC142181782 [Nicotiana tabacum]|uniref:Uncharacterized protein LOC142181782 n=1 Tax=Nicotiana tabacum TaxID=4097 RepID=A0AC58UPI5_TOBAC
MDPTDKEKTSFIIDRGTYYYKVMPFGLKNAGATYQDCIEKVESIEWTDECQQALKDIKSYLSNLSLLAKPKDGERLLIYLDVSEVAVLADFVEDFSTSLVHEAEKGLQVFIGSKPVTWTLFTDGSSNVKGACLGIVLIPQSGEIIRQAIKCYTIITNEVEYEALIAGLEIARELGIEQIVIKSDSQLGENTEANALANLASVTEVTNAENAIVIHLFHSILDQVKNEYVILPEDKKKSQVLHQKAAWYCLIRGNLFRKMFGGPLAWCLGPSQTEYVMREVHERHCGNRAGGRSLHKEKIREVKGQLARSVSGSIVDLLNNYRTSTGETPFSLHYGTEALIPVEIGEPSMRYTHAIEEANEEEMQVSLDLLEERREVALIRMAAQKQMIERCYNRKANLWYFKIGDFVPKKVFRSTTMANVGKLSPNWEGPYKARGIAGKGAYELETMDGSILPSHWNTVHLKK